MAIGVLFEFPGVSAEQYEEVCRHLNNGELLTTLADWPNEGCLFHVAGPTEGASESSTCGSRRRRSSASARRSSRCWRRWRFPR
jgi:hypothetical protein